MFVLDTNVVSELRKVPSGKAHPGVAAWVGSVSSAQLFISVITLHELEVGVRLAERADPPKGQLLRAWLDGGVAVAFADRVLDVDVEIARCAAVAHVPGPLPFRDSLIGATAVVHRMAVVTRNVRDFERVPDLRIVDPWSTGA